MKPRICGYSGGLCIEKCGRGPCALFGAQKCPDCGERRREHDEWDFRFCPPSADVIEDKRING